MLELDKQFASCFTQELQFIKSAMPTIHEYILIQ